MDWGLWLINYVYLVNSSALCQTSQTVTLLKKKKDADWQWKRFMKRDYETEYKERVTNMRCWDEIVKVFLLRCFWQIFLLVNVCLENVVNVFIREERKREYCLFLCPVVQRITWSPQLCRSPLSNAKQEINVALCICLCVCVSVCLQIPQAARVSVLENFVFVCTCATGR